MKKLLTSILLLCSFSGALALDAGTYLISCKEELDGKLAGQSHTHRGYLLTLRAGAPPEFSVASDKSVSIQQITIIQGKDDDEFILSVHFKEGVGDDVEEHLLTLAIDGDYGEGVEALPGEATRLTADFRKIVAEQGGARQPTTAPDSKSKGDEKAKPEPEGRSQ